MSRRVGIFVRHGDYHQLADTPSAHQPFPLNELGEQQAQAAVALLQRMMTDNGWRLHPIVHCSTLLRAWQTAQIISQGLGNVASISQTDLLAERGVGSGANLTRTELGEILKRDPRCGTIPPDWKTNSHFRLPFIGAESLMEAGKRVAEYVAGTVERLPLEQAPDHVAVLFVGHGGSFRHAAHHLGVLAFDEIAKVSMYHARPVALALEHGRWQQVAGEWKVRHEEN